MTKETRIWTLILLVSGVALLYKALGTETGVGAAYVIPVKPPAGAEHLPPRYIGTDRNDPNGRLSWPRTVGLWLSALFTLSVMSYLYRDNVFYKLTESIIVGVTAGYYMVAGFWDSVVRDLLVKLLPNVARGWAVPSVAEGSTVDWTFLVPLVFGLLLFLRFFPSGTCQQLAQWPLALVVGTFAGLRLVLYLDADFVNLGSPGTELEFAL